MYFYFLIPQPVWSSWSRAELNFFHKNLWKQEGKLLIKIKNIKPLRPFFTTESDEKHIFLCKAFVCLKWAGNLSGIVQLLLRREGNTFIFRWLIFVIIFWLCIWHYNVLFYLRPIWIYLQPTSFQKKKISRNKCHPVCSLFIQGFIPKMCRFTLCLKCNRPWHYRWITAVLQILLPATDLSRRK